MNKYIKFLVGIIVVSALTVLTFHGLKASTHLEPLKNGSTTVTYKDGNNTPVMVPKVYEQKNKEFRGAWIATVWQIDMPLHTSEAQYKQAYREKLDLAQSYNLNAIMFQVRGMNDTFYESEYAAYSKYLTGIEGGNPGWDVVKFLIEETHLRGMEFHAWLNPYRVSSDAGFTMDQLNNLHPDNFARQRQDLVIKSGSAHILNPGEPEVRDYIRNVISELMEKYPTIDGIQFDDYFYFEGTADDNHTYEKYGTEFSTIGDFRRDSISKLIEGLHYDIKDFNETNNKRVKFGISPSGIYKNKSSYPDGSNTSGQQHYLSHFIDTKKWVEEGWLDYIAPQVYWQFSHATAAYADVVKWWVDLVKGTGVDLFIGHSVSDANWPLRERANQILYNSQFEEIKGSIFYSLKNISGANKLDYIKDNYWTSKVPTNYSNQVLEAPTHTITGNKVDTHYTEDVTITLSSPNPIKYKIGSNSWVDYTAPVTLTHHAIEDFYYKAETNDLKTSIVKHLEVNILRKNDDVPTFILEGKKLDGKYLGEVKLTINANKTENIEYYIMSGLGSVDEFIKYEGPLTLTKKSRHIVYARTLDGVTPSKVSEIDFTIIDEVFEKPNIVVVSSSNVNDPYFTDARIELISKAPKMEYRINSGDWITYKSGFKLEEDGKYLIEARNIDAKKEIASKTIYVDNSTPQEPSISITGTKEGDNYKNKVVVTFAEMIDGVEIYYRLYYLNNYVGTYKKYTNEIVFDQNGLNGITYYAKAPNGKVSEEIMKTFTIKVDINLNVDRVIRDGKEIKKADGSIISLPTTYTEKDKQVRAIWFSTVSNIDLPKMETIEKYKELISLKFDKIKKNKFNVIFFQVRPMNDAFYYSEFAPYSRYVTGTEGLDPGFDVLAYAIEEAHKRGIELHAWLNPYRVATGTGSISDQISTLHKDNFAKQNPELLLADTNGALILNPGEPRVQEYLGNVITELVENYNIDGIHFDDYFYSYAGTPAANDKKTYDANKLAGESLDNWRRRNVNIVVENVSKIVRKANIDLNKKIKYGISPFGIWRNKGTDSSGSNSSGMQSYDSQYADSKKWVEEGWLDYITPQLYWQFDNFRANGSAIAPFADLVDWWYDLTEKNGVGLVIGQGFYRLNDKSWSYENEMIEQLRYLSKYENLLGMSFFTYNTLDKTDTGTKKSLEFLNSYYWTKSVDFPWESDVDYTLDVENPGTDPENPGPNPVDPVEPAKDLKIPIVVASVSLVALSGIVLVIIIKKKRK